MAFPAKYEELNALELSDEARRILTRIIRVAFPHPQFPNGPYERMTQKIIETSEESRWFRMALTQGLMTLDSLTEEHFLDLPDDRALAVLKRIRCHILRVHQELGPPLAGLAAGRLAET